MIKSVLFEVSKKHGWDAPVFVTENEGEPHLPQFRTSVTVHGLKFTSQQTYSRKRYSHIDAAKLAIVELGNRGIHIGFSDTHLSKTILLEIIKKKNLELPKCSFTTSGEPHCLTFIATLELNGETYVSPPASSKREAESQAANLALKHLNLDTLEDFPNMDSITGSCNIEQPEKGNGVQPEISQRPSEEHNMPLSLTNHEDNVESDIKSVCSNEQATANVPSILLLTNHQEDNVKSDVKPVNAGDLNNCLNEQAKTDPASSMQGQMLNGLGGNSQEAISSSQDAESPKSGKSGAKRTRSGIKTEIKVEDDEGIQKEEKKPKKRKPKKKKKPTV